ncbi:AraC family transcriptional regulator [Micromonospora echinofusca]|uniref:AraC family transcriptional regulator n=2 Tax=Micromonospora echinofusca TaxID=47858 RepID=UPI003409831D
MMEDHVRTAIQRVIEKMHSDVGEQFTVDEMARTAGFSKFHFCRVFHRMTGVSPGRFLSALRLQRTKYLLVSTSLSVTEISHLVGYTSVGTFSTRFSSSVGTSPTNYRRLGGVLPRPRTDQCTPPPAGTGPALRGEVRTPPGTRPHWIFLGLFPSRIQQGEPVRSVFLPGPGPFVLDQVPAGEWYLMAHAVDPGSGAPPASDAPRDLLVGAHGPVVVQRGAPPRPVDLVLRPREAFDPPVVHAVADAPPGEGLLDTRGGGPTVEPYGPVGDHARCEGAGRSLVVSARPRRMTDGVRPSRPTPTRAPGPSRPGRNTRPYLPWPPPRPEGPTQQSTDEVDGGDRGKQ